LIYDCKDGGLTEIDNGQRAFEEFIRLHHEVKRVLAKDIGTHDPVHIWQGIWDGTYDCLIHQNSIAVAEMLKTPKIKVYHCFLAGGVMNEVLKLWEIGKRLGILRGADKFQAIGRRGWQKTLGLCSEQIIYTQAIE